VKETDRLAATAALVEALGARSEIDGDELRVHGTGVLRHAETDSGGDHRMAMASAIGALAAGPGESSIEGFGSVATSYPDFLGDLGRLGGRLGRIIVAIDGPAGSGKSTVSEAVAQRLGLARLDTGAMYRAVAWAALERGVALEDSASLVTGLDIRLEKDGTEVDGTDVTAAIRTPEVSRAVSHVAAVPEVRRQLVERQRRWVDEHGGGVVEGRDIGTVVFPEAQLKVFLTADPNERARRRQEEPADGVARRDHLDSTRQISPLAVADDAHELDTTERSVEEVVEQVLSWL
jgi:cytidylate kinase